MAVNIEDFMPDASYRREIVSVVPPSEGDFGNYVTLKCGHTVVTFGDLNIVGGYLYCSQCVQVLIAKYKHT
jgi:hypothetical protein